MTCYFIVLGRDLCPHPPTPRICCANCTVKITALFGIVMMTIMQSLGFTPGPVGSEGEPYVRFPHFLTFFISSLCHQMTARLVSADFATTILPGTGGPTFCHHAQLWARFWMTRSGRPSANSYSLATKALLCMLAFLCSVWFFPAWPPQSQMTAGGGDEGVHCRGKLVYLLTFVVSTLGSLVCLYRVEPPIGLSFEMMGNLMMMMMMTVSHSGTIQKHGLRTTLHCFTWFY